MDEENSVDYKLWITIEDEETDFEDGPGASVATFNFEQDANDVAARLIAWGKEDSPVDMQKPYVVRIQVERYSAKNGGDLTDVDERIASFEKPEEAWSYAERLTAIAEKFAGV